MAGLNVYRSNRVEILADLLAGILEQQPLGDPLEAERVVVGTRGMQRWLSHWLAHRLGICANMRFLFPAEVVHHALALLSGEDPELGDAVGEAWSPDALAWSVLACLPGLLADKEHAQTMQQLRAYLGDGTSGDGQGAAGTEAPGISRRAFSLARQIGDIFDRYVVFRPEWARAWGQGRAASGQDLPDDQAWQPVLWQALQRHLGEDHRHLALRAVEVGRGKGGLIKQAPGLTRISLFGVSSLPPIFLEILGELSQTVEMNLFLLCPSNQYWEDLRSGQEKALERRRMPRDQLTRRLRAQQGEAPGVQGNPLLASSGRMARDFQVVLESLAGGYVDQASASSRDVFVDPALVRRSANSGGAPLATARALQWIQSDICHVRHPSEERDRRPLQHADDSLQFHACHGPTRQVEVLRAVLLGLLQDHPLLRPRDVLVMTPDIETYAPLISAVFSAPGNAATEEATDQAAGAGVPQGTAEIPAIPYRITDLSLRRTNPVAEALLRTLELAAGRLEASAVLDLLDLEVVRRAFGLSADDLPQIQEWITESGIRWGLDSGHRRAEDQPADDANTWSFGLLRLCLGVTMADEGLHLLQDVSPYDHMEGAGVNLMGRLMNFCATLMAELSALSAPRPASQWVDRLIHTVQYLTAVPPDAAWLTRQVLETLEHLRQQTQAARCHAAISLGALRACLQGRFEIPSGASHAPGDTVTFCAMLPMRSIPHKVVCLLGMDEDAFPRNPASLGFDLTARHPRVGDRDPRDEDRLLLLEALLSARDHLVVLYTGRDAHTNEPAAPATPVRELMAVMDQSFPPPPEAGPLPSAWMTTDHPLQPFSPDNFIARHRDPGTPTRRPWSFDSRLLRAAFSLRNASRQEPARAPAFFSTPAEDAQHEDLQDREQTIALDSLIDFFRQPVKHLLRRELLLNLEDQGRLQHDREPILLDGLQRWHLSNELMRAREAGNTWEDSARWARGQGRLPLGSPGTFLLEDQGAVVEAMLKLAADARQGEEPRPLLAIDLRGKWARVQGQVAQRWGPWIVELAMGAEKGKRLVGPWIRHLAAAAQHPDEECGALLVLGEGTAGNDPLARALEIRVPATTPQQRAEVATGLLDQLTRLYLRGRRGPLPLLERASHAFALCIFNKLNQDISEMPSPDLLARQHPAVLKKALKAAKGQWRANTSSRGGPGESEDPYLALAFGESCPLTTKDGLTDPEFARLALAFWWPLLSARRPWEA